MDSLGDGLVQRAGGIAAPLDMGAGAEDVLEHTEGVCFRAPGGSAFCHESRVDETVSVLLSNFTWGRVRRERRRKWLGLHGLILQSSLGRSVNPLRLSFAVAQCCSRAIHPPPPRPQTMSNRQHPGI